MKKISKQAIWFRAAILGLLVLMPLVFAPSHARESFPQAPDFQLTDLQGKVHTLGDYRGKVLLLNFWATWCPPCRAEIPDFIEVYTSEKNRGLEILGLSVDNLQPSDLLAFVRRFKINYPVAFASEKIIRDYQPGEYIPTTIFIDKQGRVRHKHVGQLDKETLLSLFRKLNEEK